jgi:asparagine synthase (glutamine-hydrolysing)
MTGICGWADFDTSNSDEAKQVLRQMARSGGADPNELSYIVGNRAALAGPVHSTQFYKDDQVLAGVFAPSLQSEATKSKAVVQQLAEEYRDRGELALQRLHGPFVAVLIDERTAQTFISIDRLGLRDILYSKVNDGIVFGPSSSAVRAYPQVQTELHAQGIFNYLYFHVVPSPETVFQSIERLPPASLVHFKGGNLEVKSYWQLEFNEVDHSSFNTLQTEFLEVLRQSTRRACSEKRVGAFLSGGTDSSTVSGMLGEVTGNPARTYSIGFDAQGYDETEYARTTSRFFHTDHHEYYVTPQDVVSAIPLIAKAYSQPYGNASAVPTYYCAKMAREDGIERLLGGDGGDELFGGNSRYATQWLFSQYDVVPQWMKKSLIEPFFLHSPGIERLPLLSKVKSYIEQASVPMPARTQTYNLLDRIGIHNIFTANFIEQINPNQPMTLQESVYHKSSAKSLINKMLNFDIKFTLADNDLRKVTTMCETAGIEVAYPLLDEEVIRFSARLSPNLKLRRTQLRYFFKKALKDFLPPEVITKQKHGFGLPFGVWMRQYQPLHDLTYDSLNSLKKREIVRDQFIDQLLDQYLVEYTDYYGTLVWVLMMLEQWFQHHIDGSK